MQLTHEGRGLHWGRTGARLEWGGGAGGPDRSRPPSLRVERPPVDPRGPVAVDWTGGGGGGGVSRRPRFCTRLLGKSGDRASLGGEWQRCMAGSQWRRGEGQWMAWALRKRLAVCGGRAHAADARTAEWKWKRRAEVRRVLVRSCGEFL